MSADYPVLDRFAAKPTGMSWEDAAAIPLATEAAARSLAMLGVKAGTVLLIQGAGGARARRTLRRLSSGRSSTPSRKYNQGAFTITIDKVLPLKQAPSAHEASEQGHVRGKIVLTVLPRR